jgi:hypothetical protein
MEATGDAARARGDAMDPDRFDDDRPARYVPCDAPDLCACARCRTGLRCDACGFVRADHDVVVEGGRATCLRGCEDEAAS